VLAIKVGSQVKQPAEFLRHGDGLGCGHLPSLLIRVQAKNGSNGKAPSVAKVTVSVVKNTTQWALRESEFAEGLVGGKSRNLAALRYWKAMMLGSSFKNVRCTGCLYSSRCACFLLVSRLLYQLRKGCFWMSNISELLTIDRVSSCYPISMTLLLQRVDVGNFPHGFRYEASPVMRMSLLFGGGVFASAL
jgi:hypothetical protein